VRRRSRVPPELARAAGGFESTLQLVERAKEAVVDAVPRARSPLAEALLEFEESLRQAIPFMAAWWHPVLDGPWEACRQGIEEALRRAEDLRLEAPELSFDELTFTIQDLIAPLEPFSVAAEAFRDLHA
jgi:hypothetical protein